MKKINKILEKLLIFISLLLLSSCIFTIIFCIINFKDFLSLFPKEWLDSHIDSNSISAIIVISLIIIFKLLYDMFQYVKERHKDENRIYNFSYWLFLLWALFFIGLDSILLNRLLNPYFFIIIILALFSLFIYFKKRILKIFTQQ